MVVQTERTGDIHVGTTAHSRAAPGTVSRSCKTQPAGRAVRCLGLERPGDDEVEGVGAIRSFATQVSRTRELVTKFIPDRQLFSSASRSATTAPTWC